MEIEKLVNQVNEELKKDGNFTRMAREVFGMAESTLRKKLTKGGYQRVNNQYIKVFDDNSTTTIIKPSIKPKIEVLDAYDNSKSLVIPLSLENNLIELAKNYSRILNVVEKIENGVSYSECDNKYDGEIIIELPVETQRDFRVTVRINNVAWKQFDNFCKDNSIFTKRDLLSMALVEYIKNHTK